MQNKIIKKFSRKIISQIIKMVWHVNVELYMKLYLSYLKKQGMKLSGNPKFIAGSVYFDGIDYGLIELGNDVVISLDVIILTHDYSITRAAIAAGYNPNKEFRILQGVTVGDNTFIGARSVLLPGTQIGKDVIIGAGSVVRGIIPDGSIVMGNPAKVVGETSNWFIKKLNQNNEFYKYIS